MDCTAHRIPYRQTGSFTKIVLDYIDQSKDLSAFFSFPATLQGIEKSIEQRKLFKTDRQLLVQVLQQQYAGMQVPQRVNDNIQHLLSENTFTITTAHQPNIFTGPLYFIFKILHVVRLAENYSTLLPGKQFVPVYYMGSEDADLDELGHFWLHGEKHAWQTKQTGAVGRMMVDKALLALLAKAEGAISVLPHGNEIISLLKDCYREGMTIQQSTLQLVNALFGGYGLVVLNADTPLLKEQVKHIFRDDILHQQPSQIVQQTSAKLETFYKVQAQPRDINLFYLQDNLRGRIEKMNDEYVVHDSAMRFTEAEILNELDTHPERFSPNVILRGIYQETILPNIAFVGGGGELAYWLQLQDLFRYYKVPYPVLILRNSFLVIEKKWKEKIQKLPLQTDDLFLPLQQLVDGLVKKQSQHELTLNGTLFATEKLYVAIKAQAALVDVTLGQHVENLKQQTLRRLQELEKKMLRAEKRKYADQQRQIQKIKERLFPGNGLQERIDNFMYYYALWGKSFIDTLYQHSLSMENEFVVIEEK